MHRLVSTILFLCVAQIWAEILVPYNNLGPRIINGDKADKGQFPWQVAIYVTQLGATNLCGGALISDSWVLTAGHCVQDSTNFRIALGSNVLTGNDSARVVLSTEQFVQHEKYSTLTLANDIALIPLSQPVTFSDTIKPISLADQGIATGSKVTVSGWGLTSDSGDGASTDLNYVSLVTISTDECGNAYGGFINEGVICAQELGDTVQSTCEGDSGGPLVKYDDSGNAVHVGIVSYGHPDGCESGKPSGYTETSFFRDWIKNKTGV